MDANTPPILSNKQQVLKLYESFIELYPTEEACFDALLAKIYGGQVVFCAHCKSTVLDVRENKRVGRCRKCGAETWFTAGTFLITSGVPEHGCLRFIA